LRQARCDEYALSIYRKIENRDAEKNKERASERAMGAGNLWTGWREFLPGTSIVQFAGLTGLLLVRPKEPDQPRGVEVSTT
jgi:hypothetical protein